MAETSTSQSNPSENLRILFVDDLADTRDLFAIALGLAGHRVHLASDGVEAVSAVQNLDSFDVIILDIEMPQMNGWDAARMIRQLPRGSEVPILMFTAYGTGVTRKYVEKVGANDVVYKPVAPADLLKQVHQLVDAATPEPVPGGPNKFVRENPPNFYKA